MKFIGEIMKKEQPSTQCIVERTFIPNSNRKTARARAPTPTDIPPYRQTVNGHWTPVTTNKNKQVHPGRSIIVHHLNGQWPQLSQIYTHTTAYTQWLTCCNPIYWMNLSLWVQSNLLHLLGDSLSNRHTHLITNSLSWHCWGCLCLQQLIKLNQIE